MNNAIEGYCEENTSNLLQIVVYMINNAFGAKILKVVICL